MTRKPDATTERKPIALAALKRAAKYALELARQTKTPAWVLEGDKFIDADYARIFPMKGGKKKRSCH